MVLGRRNRENAKARAILDGYVVALNNGEPFAFEWQSIHYEMAALVRTKTTVTLNGGYFGHEVAEFVDDPVTLGND